MVYIILKCESGCKLDDVISENEHFASMKVYLSSKVVRQKSPTLQIMKEHLVAFGDSEETFGD